MTTTTTKPKPTPTPADRVSADAGWMFSRAVNELQEASQAYRDRDRHGSELVLIDTGDLSELRRDQPGPFRDPSHAQTLAAYARQADELAGLVERYDTAHRRHSTVLLHALGDLHVALEELATRLDQRPTQTTAPVPVSPDSGR